MFRRCFGIVGFLLLILLSVPAYSGPALADEQAEQQQIIDVVIDRLSFPEMPTDANPRVERVVIVSDYAITDWLYADGGGETVLRKENGVWQPLGGGGGAMASTDVIALGVPQDIAIQLIQQLQAQWEQEG